MNDRIRRVLRGYTALTPEERKELEKILNGEEPSEVLLSEHYTRAIKSVTAGPVDTGGCPCCGR